jgi:Sulfotransferase family
MLLPLFVHMPRTGGTTFTELLRARLPRVLRLSERSEFAAFLSMAGHDRDRFDLIAGHMPFGADTFISRRCQYIVWLRDPVDRLVSSYFHARLHRGNGLHRYANEHTLREYVESAPTFMRDNGQTRRLATYDWSEVSLDGPFWWQRVPIGDVSGAMLDQAKENLDRSYVGIFEYFLDSARMCLNLLGVGYQNVPLLNAAARESAVDEETYEIIRKRHAPDYELYSYALAKFRRQEVV